MQVQLHSSKVRRVVLILLTLLLFSLLLTLSVGADMYIGRYDGNVAWSFDSTTGELRMYGNCGMQTPAWTGLADRVRSVYVAPGVTHLPRDAFRGCVNVRDILLPDTVTTIGAYAFADCHSLRTLVLSEKLIYVGEYALAGCSALSYVTYRGSSSDWEALCLQMSSVKGNEWLMAQAPVYTQRTYQLRISYVSAETGQPLAPQVERILTEGAGCTVLSPAVAQHVPSENAVAIKNIAANQNVTVVYYRTHCTIHVSYADENGALILPTQQLTVAHGSSIVLQAPEIEGYLLPSQFEVTLSAVTKNNTEHVFRYTRRMLSVTVRCIDEQGKALCEPIVIDDIPYRGDYDVALPQFEGYTVGVDRIRGSTLTQNAEQTVTYSPVYHAVTLRYVDEQGNELASPDVLTVRHAKSLAHTVKSITGYVPLDGGQLSLPSVTKEQSVDIVYRPERYLLTVRHETKAGTLITQGSEYVSYLQQYQCKPLLLADYAAAEQQSEQLSGTMPAAPLTITIYYQEHSSASSNTAQDASPSIDGDAPIQDGAQLSVRTLGYIIAIGGMIALILGVILVQDMAKKRRNAP
ncbi:MAG: MucBP domain-containing protein [Clostridia bacterium]|nr:MucBP domain-containing protein [Clostridia bacterium]